MSASSVNTGWLCPSFCPSVSQSFVSEDRDVLSLVFFSPSSVRFYKPLVFVSCFLNPGFVFGRTVGGFVGFGLA